MGKSASGSPADGGTIEYSPFLKFLKELDLETLDPREWETILVQQRQIIRSQNRRNKDHRNAGFFDKRRADLRVFYHWLPLIAVVLAPAFFVFIYSHEYLRMPIPMPMVGSAESAPLAKLFLAAGLAALLTILTTALFGLVHRVRRLSPLVLLPKMREARRRNHQRVKVELYETRRSYLAYAKNENPKVGPLHFARLRLLSRLYWDLLYFLELDYDLFKFDVFGDDYPTEKWISRGLGMASATAAFASWVVLDAGLTTASSTWLVVLSGGLVAAWLARIATLGFFRPFVSRIVDFQETITKPNLTADDCDRLGITRDRSYEWNWKERSEYDDTREYALWLKEQLETLRKLKENEFAIPVPAKAGPLSGTLGREPDVEDL